MTLIDRLDAAAAKTCIPGLASGPLRRRRFRWLPIIALLLGFGGYLAVLFAPGAAMPGLIAMAVATSAAAWLPMAGPLKIVGGGQTVDEFDRALATRSYLVALGSIVFFAFIGLLLIAGLTLTLGWTRDMLLIGVIATAMLMLVIWSALPTLYASWTIRPIDEDD